MFIIFVISDYYIEDYLGYKGILPRSVAADKISIPTADPYPI